MTQYIVTGMSCAACQARVEKAVSAVPGVTECAVSLLTNSMGVEGTASSDAVIKAVTDAGYGARLKDAESTGGSPSGMSRYRAEEEALRDHETPLMIKRLVSSLIFLVVLMYFSMGHSMWGWPVPEFFEGNAAGIGLLQMILASVVMLINKKFFINGFRGLKNLAPNMDSLVALGSMASYIYSTAVLFLITEAMRDGDMALAHEYHHGLYFESAAMILALITVGKTLEAYSKGRTTDALKSLMKLAPETANVIRDGAELSIPVDELKAGEIFVVRPGESIPVDGVVTEGNSAVNEAHLTGESIPIDKAEGDTVSAASINQSGFLKCRATRVGEDTTLSQIIRMVSDAAATKAPIAKIADKVSGVFVPVVICIAVVTTAVWVLLGQSFGYALARGVSVLVISCPCALGLATPVAIMVGSGLGARNGIMFKTAVSLEETGRAEIVVLDKTGTVTSGEPRVTDIIAAEGVSEETLIRAAYALEEKSEHPLAKAVVSFIKDMRTGLSTVKSADSADGGADPSGEGLSETDIPGSACSCDPCGEDSADGLFASSGILTAHEFEALPGNGVKALIDGKLCFGGNLKFIASKAAVPDALVKQAEGLAENGRTPLVFSADGKALGIIAVADQIKPESAGAVAELKNMGICVVMLTGDNERTAAAIGREAGVSAVVAGVLPAGKENVIRSLRKKGKTVMVGDGINDAPALTAADIGIAIGAGTDVAIDAADVVLMKSRLTDVPAAIRLSRATLKNIHENLFWAFFYNALCIPLAAGCYSRLFGWTLNPMVAAAAMSLSSFFVVSNALRLNLLKVGDPARDKPLKNQVSADVGNILDETQSKEDTMTKTLKIEGMMCPHCEAAVKKALEELDFVGTADVSHEKGTAIVTLTGEADDAALKKAVEDKDYKVLAIE